MDLKSIGFKIKKAREEKGYTQEQLAEKLDLSVQHISVIERGIKAPRLETFVNIANELDVDADYLLCDVLDVSAKIISNELYEKIELLPKRDQARIMNILKVIVENIN